MKTLEFNEVWNYYIKPLSGRVITNKLGLVAKVLTVNDDYVEKISHKGKITRVSKMLFRWVYDNLDRNGTVNTSDLRNQFKMIDSASFVTLVYANIPLFDVRYNPRTIQFRVRA